MKKEIITNRQKEVLEIIYNSLKDSGYPPTFEELRGELNVSSNQAVIDLLSALEKKGLVTKRQGAARTLNITLKGYGVIKKNPLVPFVGATSAGLFLETIEETSEWIDLPGNQVKKISEDVFKEKIFFVKVSGDSMTGGGINDGNILLVKAISEYKSGDIVLVRTEDGTTVKRFIHDKGRIYLKPENPKYQNIPITDRTNFIGKVIQNLNQL